MTEKRLFLYRLAVSAMAIIIGCATAYPVTARYINENTWDIVLEENNEFSVESNFLSDTKTDYDFGVWHTGDGALCAPLIISPKGKNAEVSFEISTDSEIVSVSVSGEGMVNDGENKVIELSVTPLSEEVKKITKNTSVSVDLVCNCTYDDVTMKLYAGFLLTVVPQSETNDSYFESSSPGTGIIFVSNSTAYADENIMHFEVSSSAQSVALKPKNDSFKKGTKYIIKGENKIRVLGRDGYILIPGKSSVAVMGDNIAYTEFTAETHISNQVRRGSISVKAFDKEKFLIYDGAPVITTSSFNFSLSDRLPRSDEQTDGFDFSFSVLRKTDSQLQKIELSPATLNVKKISSENNRSYYMFLANQTGISPGTYIISFKRTFSGITVKEQQETFFVDYR